MKVIQSWNNNEVMVDSDHAFVCTRGSMVDMQLMVFSVGGREKKYNRDLQPY